MKLKAVSGIMLILFLVSMLALVFHIEPVGAEPTTIIVPDDYPTIQEAVNVAMSGDIVYVRAGTYYEEVLIEEKSISLIGENPSTTIIDGMISGIPIEVRMAERVNITGFTLMYSGEQWRSNMMFERWPESGILLWNSDECNVSGNNITDNYYGLTVYSSWSGSWNNTVQGNLVTNNREVGVFLSGHHETGVAYSENTIVENTIINNWMGLGSYLQADNQIHHNNFINNTLPSFLSGSMNIWDNGYPSGGNYWSNYTGVDSNHDGIGDTTHVIDANNTDRYPLINPWTTTETSVQVEGEDYPVVIVSNTTISQMAVNQNTLSFNSSGTTGEKGYINVIFPIVNTTAIEVFIDGNKLTPPPFPVINTNGTHYFIYFEFTLSNHTIAIQFASTVPVGGVYIPINKLELLAPYIGLTILLAATVVAVVYVKKRKRNTEINS